MFCVCRRSRETKLKFVQKIVCSANLLPDRRPTRGRVQKKSEKNCLSHSPVKGCLACTFSRPFYHFPCRFLLVSVATIFRARLGASEQGGRDSQCQRGKRNWFFAWTCHESEQCLREKNGRRCCHYKSTINLLFCMHQFPIFPLSRFCDGRRRRRRCRGDPSVKIENKQP